MTSVSDFDKQKKKTDEKKKELDNYYNYRTNLHV